MYKHFLAKYYAGEEDNNYLFKLVKYIEEAYPKCIEEYKVKDKRNVTYSPAERWIIYDLILDCQKYSNLDLSELDDNELMNVTYIATKAYKHLEGKTLKVVIIRTCLALDVICDLKEDNEKKIYFGGN